MINSYLFIVYELWNKFVVFKALIYDHILFFQRVHLDIQVGEHAIDYANVAQKEKLSELQLRVRQLLDQVEQITKEQNYQRVRKIVDNNRW